MDIKAIDIFNASKRIKPYINKTPIKFSAQLNTDLGLDVIYKLENLQVSGPFKPRGGFNKILKTLQKNPNAEFVAPTAGGHGVGLSYAAKKLNAKVHILMPENADKDRIKDIINNGTSIQFFESVEKARLLYGVGGGGYLAGMALVLKTINPDIKIIGVQQNGTPCIYNWFKKGKYEILSYVPSIAEGIGGMVEEDCLTLPYVKKYVADFLLVTDFQIQETLSWTFSNEKLYVEPSGIVGLTGIREYPDFFKRFKNIVTVISGGNISFERLKALIQ